MDIRKIKKLIELLEETGISEIEITEGEESIRLSRHSNQVPMESQVRYIPAPQQAAPAPQPVGATALNAPGAAKADDELKGHKVRSPMVGTLYTSASPESAPYVVLGQTIKAGDTLCIIEAMKMFNEIESDRDGKVIAILLNNGDPVEYDQTLFVIE